jgi:two-component system response regulator DesR
LIRVLIAEPTALIREGLIAILRRGDDIELVATPKLGQEVIPTARISLPQVALVAASFPGHEGIPIARTLQATVPGCHCAILSRRRVVRDLKRAIAAGLDGFLVFDCTAEFLIEAIRQLAAGTKVIDPSLTFSALDYNACPLNARETEALRAAAQGSSTAEIAVYLSLAEGTVRNYLSRAIAKTGARNRVDAIRIAGERGWL